MKTGIVFEEGGMRGLFSTGIADVLLEEGITVDGMVGVSAGACLCCNYKSRQVGRALRYNVLLRKYISLAKQLQCCCAYKIFFFNTPLFFYLFRK